MQTLNENILKIKYSIEQLVAEKHDINQIITTKEKKVKDLKY
jgi:hypothetical protein